MAGGPARPGGRGARSAPSSTCATTGGRPSAEPLAAHSEPEPRRERGAEAARGLPQLTEDRRLGGHRRDVVELERVAPLVVELLEALGVVHEQEVVGADAAVAGDAPLLRPP